MSFEYSICEGIGIKASQLFPHLNTEKCIMVVKEQLGEDFEESSLEQFDIRDFLYGDPFENLADLLCHCDDTGTLTFKENGDGECFFYYPPSYPWMRQENEPTNSKDVHERIKKAILKICDLSDAEMESLIDEDLYECCYD